MSTRIVFLMATLLKDFKQNLSGYLYQLKVLLLFLWRGNKNCKNFQLGTEIEHAGKFDDAVFSYEKDGETFVRYLQAKYSRSDETKLKYADFVGNVKQARCNLVKYFSSYRKIRQRQEKIDDLILCTNISFRDLIMINGANQLTFAKVETSQKDDIFYDSTTKMKWQRYQLQSISTCKELQVQLQSCTNLNLLANEFAIYLFKGVNDANLDFKNFWISSYFNVLIKENVIKMQKVYRFATERTNLQTEKKHQKSNDLKEFKNLFISEMEKQKGEKLVINELKDIKFEVNFINGLKKKRGSTDLKTLAEDLVKLDDNGCVPKYDECKLKQLLTYKIEYGFSDDFINNTENLSKDAKAFSSILLKQCEKQIIKNLEKHELFSNNAFTIFTNNSTYDKSCPNMKQVAENLIDSMIYKKDISDVVESNYGFMRNMFELTGTNSFKFTKTFVKQIEHDDFGRILMNSYAKKMMEIQVLKFKQDLSKMKKLAEEFKKTAYLKILEQPITQNSEKTELVLNDTNALDNVIKLDITKNLDGLMEALNGSVFVAKENGTKLKFVDAFFEEHYIKANNIAEDFKKELITQFSLSKFELLKNWEIEYLKYPPHFSTLTEICDINEEIEEFRNLLYIVNTPNETKLIEEVGKELGESFNLLETDLITHDLFQKILDWAKQSEEEFLNEKDVTKLLDDLRKKISEKLQLGCTIEYCKKLAEYGIEFSETTEELKSFFGSSTAKILHLNTDEKLLTSIKVAQTLKSTNYYGNNGSLIFNPLTSLLRMEYVNDAKHVSKAFDTNANVLIIVDKEVKNDFQHFCEKICQILCKSNKKVVVISDEKSDLMLALYKLNNSITVIFHPVEFNDLTKESQQMIRKEILINFQGNELYLEHFLTEEESSELIDPKTLEEMILGEKIKIGKPGDTFPRAENDYYRPRQIRLIQIHDNLFEEKEFPENHLFVFEGLEVGDFLKRKHVDNRIIRAIDLMSKNVGKNKVFIVMEESEIEKQFQQICEKFPEHCIHWLKYESNKLYWFHSHVTESFKLSQLKKYMSDGNEYVSESFFGEFIEQNKIVIIADTAGMGKSTILTSFSKKLKNEEQWIIRINLNKYTSDLLQMQKCPKRRRDQKLYLNFEKFNDETDVYEKLILESLIVCEPTENTLLSLENRIFNHFFTKRGILILLDGFDEINPDYGDVVLNLVHMLRKNENNRIWITSRTNFKKILEYEFNTFAYDLKPFDRNDQEIFLKQFWISSYKSDKGRDMPNQNRLPNYMQILLDEANRKIGGIIGIPLQTKMLAEVFREGHDDKNNENNWISCYEYVESEVEIPLYELNIAAKIENIFMLYENFFKEKVITYFLQEKGIVELSKPFARKLENAVLNAEYFVHKIFGCLAFSEKDNETLLTRNEISIKNEWLKDFREGIENIGIIDDFNEDGHPIFTHFTYGEYLAACFLVDKLCVASSYCEQVFRMANDIFSKDVPIFVECFKHRLKQEIKNNQLKEGLKGKSVLQFVIQNGFINCINVFMQSNDFNHKFPDADELGKTVLHYAAECNNLNGIINLTYWIYNLCYDLDLFLNYISNTLFKKEGNITFNANVKCFFDDLKAAAEKDVKYKTEVNIRTNICELQDRNATCVSDDFAFRKNESKMKNEFLNLFSVQSIENIINYLRFNDVNSDMIQKFANNLCSRNDIIIENKIQIMKKLVNTYADSCSLNISMKNQIIRLIIQNDCGDIINIILTNEDFEIREIERFFKHACECHAHQVIKTLLPHLQNSDTFYHGMLHRPDEEVVRSKTRLETIKLIFKNNDALLNDKYAMGRTALHTAVECECNIKTIEYLVEKGFDPNEKDEIGKSPWTIAVKNAYDDAIKYFLSKFDNLECDYMVKILNEYYKNSENFDFNQQLDVEPLLRYAITKENVALSSFLIQKGAHVYQKGLKKKTQRGRGKRLIKLKISLKDENGNTQLHLAAKNGDTEEIITLLKRGASYNIKNEKGETPKDIAKPENKTLFIELDQLFCNAKNNDFHFLTKYGSDSHVFLVKDENSKTLLHYTVMKNNVEAVKTLINLSDENINEKDSEDKTPVYYAVKKNNKEMLNIMLERASLDFSTFFNTKAYKKIEENDCKVLISHIKKCTDYAFNEDIDEMNNELALIKNNKDFNFVINVRPHRRMSILDYALKYSDISLDMLQKGIVVQQLKIPKDFILYKNYKTEKLLSSLIQIAEYVLLMNYEPESIIKYFNNKFMEALSYCTNDISVADKIISNARFDFENIYGVTLLHIAAISDEEKIAEWLINEKHADPFAKDHDDNDVYTLAEKNNSQKVFSVLPPKSKRTFNLAM